ncbi:hypothetical protein OF83DRAFT_1128090 [Amylostereum chailletii]|nr:hypothetical protein OF83DRAFT_1128090 [Amylostereum chailletii]
MSPSFFLHLSLFLSSLVLVGCWAETVSLSRSNRIPEKVDDLRLLPPHDTPSSSNPQENLELLDVVLVASVDGKFHALNRQTGNILWSMPVLSPQDPQDLPSYLQPLVSTQHVEYDPEFDDLRETYIVEPQSGDIYVTSSSNDPLQRLPFSMSQLVDMSPFSFGDSDKRVFVGRKKTSLLLMELQTGRVKAALDSECPWDPFDDLQDAEGDIDLDELEGSKMSKEYPVEIAIGRTDYHIAIYPRRPSSSSTRQPVQKLSFSAYGPNKQDQDVQLVYRRTADDVYVEPLPNGEIISFRVQDPDDPSAPSQRETNFVWGQKFSSPIVAVFDVVRGPHREAPFVLLQPRPRLQDVLPSFDLSTAAKERRFPGLESAYVGLVEETGSLFAMSPDRFPLVVFGGAEDHRLKAIDPPPGVMDPYASVPAMDVRALCKFGSTDRRCSTGIRPLREDSRSRLARLLDGAPSVALPPSQNMNSQAYENTNQPVDVRAGNRSWSWIIAGPSSATLGEGDAAVWPASGLLALAACAMFGLGSLWASRMRPQAQVSPAPSIAKSKPVVDIALVQESVPHLDPSSSRSDATASTPSSSSPPTPENPPIPLSPVPQAVKLPPSEKGPEPADNADDVGEDESDKEGETAMPERKKTRRKRGKKKKGGPKEPDEPDVEDTKEKQVDGEEAVPPTPSLVVPSRPQPSTSPSLIVSDTVLGFGSHGTVVYQGSLQGRAVAVKRLLQDFVTLASREVSLLQDADDHPNVIRYYYQESRANFLYIALELCPASLADIIERPNQFRDVAVAFTPKRALQQITSGLRHLHALKIVHRDIKPQNILISSAKKGESAGHRMLISDFGLCRKLEVDQTSFLPTANGMMGVGTFGWRAPEILRGEVKLDDTPDDSSQSSRDSVSSASGTRPTRLTKSVDIFALGCLFYYCLTNGDHPFGDRFEREVNILKGAHSFEGLEVFGEEGAEAADLIGAMLAPEASDRPDTSTCLMHPYFWNPGRRLGFLQDASDRFEIMCRDPRDPHLVQLEIGAIDVVGPDWHARLDKIFVDNLGKFRKYDGRSVQDLLRALRNKKHHYQDLPENVRRHVGSMPEGFLSYFTRRYPRLFLHVHGVISNSSLRQESMFRSYFTLAD